MKARSLLATPKRSRLDGPERILGIDPGTLMVGYAIVEDDGSSLKSREFGVIRASRTSVIGRRLCEIHRGLVRVIETHRPTAVALERVFFGRSASSALRIGEGRGVALLTCTLHGIPVSEYAPAVVKKSVAGSGAAPKLQVQEMVKRILSLPTIAEPEDASDALALCICHSARSRFARLRG